MEEKLHSDAFWEDLITQDADRRHGGTDSAPQVSRNGGAEEPYGQLMAVMDNKPIQREALRRILELCRTPQPVGTVEDAIAAYPEFPLIMQPPYRLIRYLIDGGGLVRHEMDVKGQIISEKRKAQLSRDELDDMVEGYQLQTTAIGMAVADDLAPFVRMRDTFLAYPDRACIFVDLLEFCLQPRTYADVEELIGVERIKGLKTYNYEPGSMMKPSVFLDNMERAGALVWFDHGWHTTSEGERLLSALSAQTA